MKITMWTIQTPRTSLKFVTSNISWWKKTLKKIVFFSENITALTTFEQSPTNYHFLMQHCFFNPPIGKHTAPAYQNTVTFYQYLSNSRSNMHVYQISLHPKKAVLPTFLGQTPHSISEKQKHRNTNLHNRKAGSVAVILSLGMGIKHLQKVAQ